MKKHYFISILLAILFSGGTAISQDAIPPSQFNFGVGFGIDYGGLGARFTYMPIKHVGIFAAGGYNLVGFGFNVGVNYKFLPEKKVNPTVSAMYGYNGVIKVQGAEHYNKTYYGPSLSAGIEINSRKRPGNYFNLEIVVPFRPQSFSDDWDEIKNDPTIDTVSDPLPVAFSIGYHFAL